MTKEKQARFIRLMKEHPRAGIQSVLKAMGMLSGDSEERAKITAEASKLWLERYDKPKLRVVK